jgi:signal transduction histidine kinase
MSTYFFVIFLTVLIFELSLMYMVQSYYLKEIENRLRYQAEIIASNYEGYLANEMYYRDLNQMIGRFFKPDLDIEIFDVDKTLISTSVKNDQNPHLTGDLDEALKGNVARYMGKHGSHEDEVISVSFPVFQEGQVQGVVRVRSSLANIRGQIYEIFIYIIIFGVFLILSVLGISYFVAKGIVKPILKVVETTNQMAAGNLSARNLYAKKNELGRLAYSINHMAEQIQENEKMKNQFISSVSHELRTPLTSISGWAQTIMDTYRIDEETRYSLNIILDESNRLNEMVEELLDFSRLQSNTFKLHPEYIDIHPLVRKTFEHMIPRANRQRMAYDLSLPEETCIVYADPKRIQQVLINLLDNAFKFTEQGGRISVTGTFLKDQSLYCIKVEDTGKGIEKTDIQNIKKRFYKCQGNKKDKGIGLGLSICDEIIKLHHGQFEIHSEVGKGTAVDVFLPVE